MQETQEAWVQSLCWEDHLRRMATYSTILAWRIPWTEQFRGLQFIGWQRVRHNWSNWACMHTHTWLQRLCLLFTTECVELLAKYFTLIYEFSKILTCNSNFLLHFHYNLYNFFILIAKCFYKVIIPSYWFQLMRSYYCYLLLIAINRHIIT